MRPFEHAYLYSDVDGTIATWGNHVPQRNIAALKRFVQLGGHFGLATGRCLCDAQAIIDQLPVNLPCILNNGAQIYDAQARAYLRDIALPEASAALAQRMLDEAPAQTGLIIANAEGFFRHASTRHNYTFSPMDARLPTAQLHELSGPFHKFLFLTPPEQLDALHSALCAANDADLEFARSSAWSIEILNAGVNKGAALRDVCALLGVPMHRTIAIGDSFNDLEMLRSAGFSATVPCADPQLKSHVNLIVGDCEQGAVADLIEHIERYPFLLTPETAPSPTDDEVYALTFSAWASLV